MMSPVVPEGAMIGFTMLDGKITETAVKTGATTAVMEGGLSEIGMAAILASEGVEEIGEDWAQTGISGKAALDIL
jgi:hypothetical protein